jgi:hypothetical protein
MSTDARAMNLSMADLFAAKKKNGSRREVATYDYRDECGRLLDQVCV